MTYAAYVSSYQLEFSEVIQLFCLQLLKSKLLIDKVEYSYNTIQHSLKLNTVENYVVSKHLCFALSSCEHPRNVLESKHNTPNT
jgi:hypothetical protein